MVVLARALPLALVPALVPIPVLTRAAAGPVVPARSVGVMADEDATRQGHEDGAEEAEVAFHGAHELIHTAGPKRSCLKASPPPRSRPLLFAPPAFIG